MHLVLRKRILEGLYPRGSYLAGERELAIEFDVARVTVRSALAGLQRDGLVRREQGRGTIVVGPVPKAAVTVAPGEDLDGFDVLFESILSMGLHSKARVLDMRTVDAPGRVADALGIADGAPVSRIVRVRLLDQRPIAYSTAWLPAATTIGLTRRELSARPLLSWLQHQGLRVERADETVSACAADVDVAAALDVQVGAPLLSVHRTLFDHQGAPLLLFEGQFRPERYQYRLQLSREPRSARIRVVTDSA